MSPGTHSRFTIVKPFRILNTCGWLLAVLFVAIASSQTAGADELLVANFQGGTISKVDSVSGSVSPFVSGLNLPVGLAIDKAGYIYTAESRSGIIDRISPTDVVTPFATGLNFYYMSGMTFDSAGNLFVGANHFEGTFVSAILKFNSSGALVSTWSYPSGAGPLQPTGLTVDLADNLWVTDYSGNGLYEISPAGVATEITPLYVNPVGVAFDSSGNLFVAKNASGTIVKRDLSGDFTDFAGGIDGPAGICFDTAGNLYVGNSPSGLGSTLTRVTPDGTPTIFATGLNGPFTLANYTMAVPEPNTLAILALGVAGFGWRHFRRRSSA